MLENDPDRRTPRIESGESGDDGGEQDEELTVDALGVQLQQELEIYESDDSDSDSSELDMLNRSADSEVYYSDDYEFRRGCYIRCTTYNYDSEFDEFCVDNPEVDVDGYVSEDNSNDEHREHLNVPQELDGLLDGAVDVLFDPPLFTLRYRYVMDTLQQAQAAYGPLKTVVDLGCSDGKFIKYFRHSDLETERVLGVDVDGALLHSIQHRHYLKPLVSDYLNPRAHPFEIELLERSVAEKDARLYQADAVCAIELIEHLHPHELAQFPKVVFGFVQPKVAVVSTPNKEYNVLFQNFDKEFRHPDHKFEWTRNEFKTWINDILTEYPEYCVEMGGVGFPDLQPNPEGPCSQIAVFHRKKDAPYREAGGGLTEYRSVTRHVYPVNQDDRSLQQKIFDEVTYVTRQLVIGLQETEYVDYDHPLAIPVDSIIEFDSVRKLCSDKQGVIDACTQLGMNIKDDEVLVELEDPYLARLNHCTLFGNHDYDPEEGSIFDCPCFLEDEEDEDTSQSSHFLEDEEDEDTSQSSHFLEEEDQDTIHSSHFLEEEEDQYISHSSQNDQ